MCCVLHDVDITLGVSGFGPKRDAVGRQLCEQCGHRLDRVQHHRPYGAGRACKKHSITEKTSSASAPALSSSSLSASSFTKRPFDSLRRTQKWRRRKKAREALAAIDCPITELQEQSSVPPEAVIHLSTSDRERIRSVHGLRIPCEQTIINCKNQLASTLATETATFVNGAHITDPVRFVSALCFQSPLLVVGGDAGGGLTKLGVTYLDQRKTQTFAALLVYAGKDTYEDLNELRHPDLTPFTGDSALFSNIFIALQHLIDMNLDRAFLNGDWPFLNTVLGLKNASAIHPCPICTVSSSNLFGRAHYRGAKDRHSQHQHQSRLLSIDSERIVPTPLHLFLGISNRIILDAFSELIGKEIVEKTLETVTTIHSSGCGGKSDLFDLNGPEIRKWIKKGCSSALRSAAEDGGELRIEQKSTYNILNRWLVNLHEHLLHKNEWTLTEIERWRAAVDDIQQNWCSETGQSAFPKLHMLRHSLEFAERHRFLGRASEAQIESYHAQFNSLYHRHHLNMSHNVPERTRRTLADTTLRAVQPLVKHVEP